MKKCDSMLEYEVPLKETRHKGGPGGARRLRMVPVSCIDDWHSGHGKRELMNKISMKRYKVDQKMYPKDLLEWELAARSLGPV